jgi:hypothetical protein
VATFFSFFSFIFFLFHLFLKENMTLPQPGKAGYARAEDGSCRGVG